jgi:hypothetical protein
MGVYIKGMEMPTSCIACLLNFGEKRPEYGLTICCPYSDGVISWRDKAFDNGRLASCGIVPVPPHGDLIDRDALIKDGWLNLHKEVIRMGGYAIHELPLKNPSIPVIIPAEEGET